MAEYPEIQVEVQNELDRVVGRGRQIQLDDRSDLPFTNATMLEVMRMTTIGPFGVPKYTIRDTNVGGFDIDKDTVVLFNLNAVSFDKELWGDPDKFRPTRFINDKNELDVSASKRITIFGAGRRRCPGEKLARINLFIFFSTLMQNLSVMKPQRTEYDLRPVIGLVYQPKDFKVIVTER